MRIVLPASWVSSGHGLPQVCSRHGEPAAEGVGISVPSRPPTWAYALLAMGPLPFAIVVYAVRKTVRVPSWPFCARCKAVRISRLVIGVLLVVGGIAAMCASLALLSRGTYEGNGLGLAILVPSVFLPVGGLVVMIFSGWASVARARASEDGAKV